MLHPKGTLIKNSYFQAEMHGRSLCLKSHKYFFLQNIAQYYEFACGHSKNKFYLWSSIFVGQKFSFIRNFKKNCRNFCPIHFSEYLNFFQFVVSTKKKLFGRVKIAHPFIKKSFLNPLVQTFGRIRWGGGGGD